MSKHQNSSKWISNLLSRRDVLRAGGLLLPATALAPALFTRVSQAAGSGAFDYYISRSGSDSNPGTLASPWAITAINTKQSTYAGKRLGILPGTYDVSGLMWTQTGGGDHGTALMISGGPNSSTRTYIGTSNSSGQYQQGTATLDAKGVSGVYGGGSANNSTVIGQCAGYSSSGFGPPAPPHYGNWILDGIAIVGFSNWALQVGNYDGTGTGGAVPNTTVQNCTFANSVCVATTTHPGPIVVYSYNNCLISNCWFHNNINTGADQTHYSSITGEGFGGSSGLTIEYCSVVQSPGIYIIQDNGAASNTTVRYCYFDLTATTGVADKYAIAGCTNTATGQPGNSIHHNIVRGGGVFDNVGFQANYSAQPTLFYNNTWDRFDGNNLGFRCLETTGASALVTAYNNLMYDDGNSSSTSYGYMAANVDGFALCDYNIYGTLMSANQFSTYGASGGTTQTARTFAAWKTAIGGDAHSSTSSANLFTKIGVDALQYQVQSGSPAYNTGRIGGLSSGAPCNVGAWDGTVTQIGYSAGGAPSGSVAEPNPPVLTVVS